MTNNRISAVLIVKNEKQMLRGCLQSVADADELIVCDTGSTDGTVALARSLGAQVFTDYVWRDNFAEARNHAASKASGDWILSIDADERLEPGGIAKLKQLPDGGDAWQLKLRASNNGAEHSVIRFFRRVNGPRWIGRIHNTVAGSGRRSDISIVYGYSPAHTLDKDRALRILSADLKEKPDDSRTLYYLAREYWYRKNYPEAIRLWERYLQHSHFKSERADACLLLARCYWQLSQGDKARDYCLTALNINANFTEAARFMAEISWPKNARVWRLMANCGDNSEVLFLRGARPPPPPPPAGMKLADIVIPHHNRHDMLLGCLAELPNTLFNINVIAGRGSFAANANAGARLAETERIIFLNDDVTPDVDTLVQLAQVDADLCGLAEAKPKGRRMYGLHFAVTANGVQTYGAFNPAYVHAPAGYCFAVRRSWWETYGGFNTEFRNGSEDADLGLRALEAGARIAYLDRAMPHHCAASQGRHDHTEANHALFRKLWPEQRVRGALARVRPYSACCVSPVCAPPVCACL